MHYQLEIIMPPVADVKSAVAQILEPFDEQGKDEEGFENRHGFWDFYVIGGRWAGAKLEAMFDPERLKRFTAELITRGVTISGVQFGKQELSPADQIPMVDALWCEFFPESPIKICPLFQHYNDRYKHSDGFPDVMRLGDVPKSLKASRVIVAGPTWNDAERMEAQYMIQDSVWNGVTHVDCQWDGLVTSAVAQAVDRLKHYTDAYVARNTPGDDWLVVTVDYHS
jgi:hypothetical protein